MAYGGQELFSSESIQEKIWKCLQPDYGGEKQQQQQQQQQQHLKTVDETSSIPSDPWTNFPAPTSSAPLYARNHGSGGGGGGGGGAPQGLTRMLSDSLNSLTIKEDTDVSTNSIASFNSGFPRHNRNNSTILQHNHMGSISEMTDGLDLAKSRTDSSNIFNKSNNIQSTSRSGLSYSNNVLIKPSSSITNLHGSKNSGNDLTNTSDGFINLNNGFSNSNNGFSNSNNEFSKSNSGFNKSNNGFSSANNGFSSANNAFSSASNGFGTSSNSNGISITKDSTSSSIQDGFTSWAGAPSCWSTGLTTSLGNGLFPSTNVSPTSSNSSFTSSNNSLSSSSDSESSIRIKWKTPGSESSSSSLLTNQHSLFSSQRKFEELSSSASLEEKYLQLTRQIESFARIHAPSKDVLDRVENLRSSLLVIIWKFFPLARLHLFGSCCNGFGSDTSDVDLCLIISPGRKPNQLDRAERYLKDLEIVLTTIFGFRDVEFVNARVPILKFSDAFSGCHCDLSVNNEMAVRNTHLLRAYSKMDDRVRPLVMAVKKWASARKINDATQGTLSSYAIVLMCIHYLQCGCKPPVLISLQKYYPEYFCTDSDVNQLHFFEPWKMIPCNTSENKLSVGELFVGFFQYFANVFVWDNQVISVREGSCVMKHKYKGFEDKYMCIEDPYESYNTTRTVYNLSLFNLIKREFRRANWRLSERLSLEHIT